MSMGGGDPAEKRRGGADAANEAATRRLQRLLSEARCLLWHAVVRAGKTADGAPWFDWEFFIPDETAAQRFLPLAVPAGQRYADAFHHCRPEEDLERMERTSHAALREGRDGYTQEYRCRRADGQTIWIREDVRIDAAAPGRWDLVGICTDITERRRADEDLRHLTAHARCLLWHGTVTDTGLGPGAYHWDTHVFDEAAAQAFLPLDLLPGGERYTAAWYRHRLPEGQRLTDIVSAEALRANLPYYSAEFGCRGRDGAVRWFSEQVHVEPLSPSQSRPVGVCTDITERKRAEEEKNHLLRRMEEGVRQQRAFLRDVLSSVTEGRLQLCDDPDALPSRLPLAFAPIPLAPESLRTLRARTTEIAGSQGHRTDRIHDLLTGAGEAAMNAVVHAGAGVASVGIDEASGRVQVWVEDRGAGIALERLPRATLERGFTTAGTLGHGFWMMLKTIDRVWLLTGPSGTTLVLEQEREAPEASWLSHVAKIP
jgi:PAS domain-containing protein/anti-sigma regulatory factor (Ser/Thr protein kinase)